MWRAADVADPTTWTFELTDDHRREIVAAARSASTSATPSVTESASFPLPTLGPEIAREGAKARKAFAARLDEMIGMIADQLPELPRKAARAQAIAAISTMAGALVLSRIAGSGEFSEEILGSAREAALSAAADPAAKKPRPGRN